MIELKNVYKTYRSGGEPVKAVNGISLTIADGEFVAIMGASGSGKSTLMHVLGLLDRFDSGTYFLDGRDVSLLSDDELAALRNHSIGFVFQQFHLLARTSALENAKLPLLYAGTIVKDAPARKALESVGLSDRIQHHPNQLSGGQQQRVAIARALVNEPGLIFADEPTGNLDSKSKQEIVEILKDLNRQGKTVVIVTHEPEVAAHANRVITMRDGIVISDTLSGKTPATGVKPKKIEPKTERDLKINGMRFWEYFHEASFAIFSHKLRAFLSILGILIGIAAVIAMLSIGEGAKISIEKQLASLGSNLLMVRPGSPKSGGISLGVGASTRFTLQDVDAIAGLKSEVSGVSPSIQGKGQLVYANKNWNTQVEGVGIDYARMRASEPEAGRFFTAEEVKTRDKVVLLGTTVARELFGDTNPIGETMKINLINFKIIGVLPSKGTNTFRDQDDTVLIPATTAMYRLFGKQYVDTIYVEAASPALIDSAQDDIQQLLVKRHRLRKEDEDSFQIRNMSDIKNAMETTTKTMSLLLGGIAAISLLVGGIGIMNIMLVSVSERTREIGLRKAIGATNRDILIQFLIEAILMCFVGGLLGIALGVGAAVVITKIAGWSVSVSMFSIILATAVSLIIGVVFGLWPAKQASQLNPIDALRYE